ncbi:related to long chain fatty alcohol oxidase [Ceraceosorus bombacis]|uniref:Long-chain-alcohol oxidase n=1 Tax=Ceraceosorus bombacis TaxID=401625 RepID=A0A0P1BH59_9BASI|nr:related to long chain fatty alcohol oxidase [Ceraceosorus bombacis]
MPYSKQLIKASDIFSDSQKATLSAVADVFVPHLEGEDAARVIASLPTTASDRQRELVAAFAKDGFIDHPYLVDAWAHQARTSLSITTLNQISLLLTVLSTRAGTFALTGRLTAFPNLPRKDREAIMYGWLSSPITLIQKAAAGFKGLSLITYYRFHQPAWEATGYADSQADDWQPHSEQTKDLDKPRYEYEFENDKVVTQPAGTDVIIDTDVLIIGSGSGGGVAAQYLAQRGLRVLVVDKGGYLRQKDVLGREDQGYGEMYEGEGLLPVEDGSLNVLAGSTFGGGTTVNWSASLKPRHYARELWAKKHGVPYYRTPYFGEDLNAVCNRMGCSTHAIKHNLANSLLALGAQRSGQPVEAVPQNSGGHVHYCGKCQLGCVSGHKQGGVVTWLRDAAETGNAAFMIKTEVERILFDPKDKRTAIGALATCEGRKVTIKANKHVIVSGGSISTPAVLLRSPELKFNKQIGKNLHLHPTTVVTGWYDFPIKPWEGSLLTMVSNAAELVDAEGWGCKIEVIASSPSIQAAFSTFQSPEAHKTAMLNYAHSFNLIIITRDRDPGNVFVDSEGKARMNYTISKHDQASMVQGILRACDIHMMAGAKSIATVQHGVPIFEPGVYQHGKPAVESILPETTTIPSTATPTSALPRNLSDEHYVAWRQKVEKAGARPHWTTIGSAHQMGSCAMGGTPATSACDPEGRVWGTKNLSVADSAALPSATGVNPMISTMATARYVARNVAKDLGVERPEGTVGPALKESRL